MEDKVLSFDCLIELTLGGTPSGTQPIFQGSPEPKRRSRAIVRRVPLTFRVHEIPVRPMRADVNLLKSPPFSGIMTKLEKA
jgi:hypothetical protein